jgi:hypothetical protein
MSPLQKKFLQHALLAGGTTYGIHKGNQAWKGRIARLPAARARKEERVRQGLKLAGTGYLGYRTYQGVKVGYRIGAGIKQGL